MVTPLSCPFELVIAASKQLLYGVRPEGKSFFLCLFYMGHSEMTRSRTSVLNRPTVFFTAP